VLVAQLQVASEGSFLFFQVFVLKFIIQGIKMLPGDLFSKVTQVGDESTVVLQEDVVVSSKWSENDDVSHVKGKVVDHLSLWIFL